MQAVIARVTHQCARIFASELANIFWPYTQKDLAVTRLHGCSYAATVLSHLSADSDMHFGSSQQRLMTVRLHFS